jgi:site-specific DNA-methyltransferase (adenine-specific)
MTNPGTPDILNCLANLSSDEVFTSPELANQMIDLLPSSLFSDPNSTFLDPCCKSGVFLREITKRLIAGLASAYPDIQERVDHILTKQVFGIAPTQLTALMSRRTLYCSKKANGKYSVTPCFQEDAQMGFQGNIKWKPIKHTWSNERCVFCGANQRTLQKGAGKENYAYWFIHEDKPEEIFNMKFDVIIGNPPYQLEDGGNKSSATPIYQLFVTQAMKLNPKYLSMIIPSRWFSGGKGLDEFRSSMLGDKRLKDITDFPNANECFPGVDIAGGVCYFLWDSQYNGLCNVTTVVNGKSTSSMRKLDEFDTFVRYSEAVSVINKVLGKSKISMEEDVSTRKPFGLATDVKPTKDGDITLRYNGGKGPFKTELVPFGHEMISKWKVIMSYLTYDHAGLADKNGQRRIFSTMEILAPGEICSETYLVVGVFDNKEQAENCVSYLKTKFVRFLVSQIASTQHITKGCFKFVPKVGYSHPWSDVELDSIYNIDEKEAAFIDKIISPME